MEPQSLTTTVTTMVAAGENGSVAMLMIGGPAQDLSNFQMAPIPILSVPTCSTSSPHDILKVSLKKIDQNLPVGRVEHDIVDRVGLALGIRSDLD